MHFGFLFKPRSKKADTTEKANKKTKEKRDKTEKKEKKQNAKNNNKEHKKDKARKEDKEHKKDSAFGRHTRKFCIRLGPNCFSDCLGQVCSWEAGEKA